MRSPVEITRDSAASIAKWRMKEMLKEDEKRPPSQRMPLLKKMAMQSAIQKGGGVDEIAEMLYSLGMKLSIDQNDEDHKAWISTGAVFVEKK